MNVRLIIVALLGALGVAAGAFGAHGLRGLVEPPLLETWKTGALYHQLHAVALLALVLHSGATGKSVSWPFLLWSVGILLFSGSLYALVLTGIRPLGAITPMGGLALIAGWLSLWTLR